MLSSLVAAVANGSVVRLAAPAQSKATCKLKSTALIVAALEGMKMVDDQTIQACMMNVVAKHKDGISCRDFLIQSAAAWGEVLTEDRLDELFDQLGFEDGDRISPGPKAANIGRA